MHAGIGTAGTRDGDVHAFDRRQRRLEFGLHRPRIRLPLKAGEVRAVIGESQLERTHNGSRFWSKNRYCGLDPGFTTGMP